MCRSGSSFHLLETMIALPFLLSLVGYAYELYLRSTSFRFGVWDASQWAARAREHALIWLQI